jgi:D-3-phosphoglycerate dehydrogenase / 2-oxoglutarate reductase
MDLKECRLLVTPTSFGKNNPAMRRDLEELVGEVIYNPTTRPLSSAELAGLLPGCHGYIAGLDEIDRAALERSDRLIVIARYGVGVDNVDLAAAREKGIQVTNTPGANSVSVAELTVGFILALARQIPEACGITRQGGWPRLNGLSLEEKVVGLIGFGAIGKQVARRLAGFDCHILAYDPFPDLGAAQKLGVELIPLEQLLGLADFVSLNLPLLAETRGMVNVDFLAKMKPGSHLINTSRGELIDEQALLQALNSGRLRGAAIDVFTIEPPGADNPLFALPQVIVTPHCGAHTDGAINNMGRMSLHDCLAVLRGEEPRYRVV